MALNVFKKSGETICVASEEDGKLKSPESLIYCLAKMTKSLVQIINTDIAGTSTSETKKEQKFIQYVGKFTFIKEYLEAAIFAHQCTDNKRFYYVLQVSDKGKRILVYQYIPPSSITTRQQPVPNLTSITDIIQKELTDILNTESIDNVLQFVQKNITKQDITNTKLYFLD